MTIRTMMAMTAIAAGLAMTPSRAIAQQHSEIAPASAANSPEAAPAKYSLEELIPLTVHQAWLKSGRNEDAFFDMVTQLAELSAKDRNLELPQTEAAGQQVGQMIKTMAKQDTDQLLYAVVDAAVRKVGKPLPATTTSN